MANPLTLMVTPPSGSGVITNTPTGTVYAFSPGQTISVQQDDVPFLLAFNFSLAQPLTYNAGPRTSGGLTTYNALLGAAPAANVKAAQGQLYHVSAYNVGLANVYVRFYNTAGVPTIGSGTPVWEMVVPGLSPAGGAIEHVPEGLPFTLGIGYTATGGIGNADATAIAANTVVLNLGIA